MCRSLIYPGSASTHRPGLLLVRWDTDFDGSHLVLKTVESEGQTDGVFIKNRYSYMNMLECMRLHRMSMAAMYSQAYSIDT